MKCQKNMPKSWPKIDFRSHFGLPKPLKIEEKTYKNDIKKKKRKKEPKKCQQDPLGKPVLARNGKSENVLEQWKHATSS